MAVSSGARDPGEGDDHLFSERGQIQRKSLLETLHGVCWKLKVLSRVTT